MTKFKKYTLFIAICAIIVLVLSTLILSSCKDTKKDENEPMSFIIEELYTTNGELNIYGKIYIPTKASETEKFPAVVLSHSANLTADSMNAYCIGFAERGYVAYAFDFCGGSSNSRSDGSTQDMTIFTEMDDLKAVINTIKNLDYVNPNKLFLFGTSQGGLVSALVANDIYDEISGLILLYPAFNIPEIANNFSNNSGNFGALGFSSYGKKFISTIKDYDVYSNIANFTGDVLIIHGSNDFIVNKEYSQKAADIYHNCQLYIIDGATHGFNNENLSYLGIDMSSLFGNYDNEVWSYIDTYLNAFI